MIDIKKLALLARIKLGSDEEKKLQKEFEDILSYISKLKEADVSSVDDRGAGRIGELENVVREDEGPHESGKFSEDLLKEAPTTENNYVKVKHIMGGE